MKLLKIIGLILVISPLGQVFGAVAEVDTNPPRFPEYLHEATLVSVNFRALLLRTDTCTDTCTNTYELKIYFDGPFGVIFSLARTVPYKNDANCGMICALRQLFLLDCLTDCSKEQIDADKRKYPSRLGLSPTTVKRSSILSNSFGVLGCAAAYSYFTGDVSWMAPASSFVLAGLCYVPKLVTKHNILGSLPHVLKEDIEAYSNVNCEIQAVRHSFSRNEDFLQFLRENKGRWFIVLIYPSKLCFGHYVDIKYIDKDKIIMNIESGPSQITEEELNHWQISEEELILLASLDTWKRKWYYHLVKWFDPSFALINCIEIKTKPAE